MYQVIKTANDYFLAEVVSALQKAIRRSDEEAALYWATELDLSGFGGAAWKRLRIIVSEDIGIADPMLPAIIRALNDNWHEDRKEASKEKRPQVGKLYLVHAVMLACRALKSRAVNNAALTFYWGRPLLERREIPDEALDMHTAAGRKLGRGIDHFNSEASLLVNESQAVPDRYKERAETATTKIPRPAASAPEQPDPGQPVNGDLFEGDHEND